VFGAGPANGASRVAVTAGVGQLLDFLASRMPGVSDWPARLARGDVLGVAAGTLRAREAAGSGASIATQMHGAIGFTREHRLQLFTTSLWTWRDEFGGQVSWAKLLGQAALDAGGSGYWPMVTAL